MKAIAYQPHAMPIADIKVGQRHRRDLGDIDALAASIAELGLLHPVVVRPDGVLIAGERRLEACKSLGWQEVPATVIDLSEIVRGELAENAIRKDFLPSEIDAIRRARDESRVLGLQPKAGKWRTLVVDPPWPYDIDHLGRGNPQYVQMTREDIMALPAASWAEDNCHMYLWITNANLPLGIEAMAAWGFTYKSLLTWIKPRFGLGTYFRNSTEHCLFGLRGKLMTRSTSTSTHFEAPVGAHSEKPERFYEIVRAASYPPYGEAFQRKAREDFASLFTAA